MDSCGHSLGRTLLIGIIIAAGVVVFLPLDESSAPAHFDADEDNALLSLIPAAVPGPVPEAVGLIPAFWLTAANANLNRSFRSLGVNSSRSSPFGPVGLVARAAPRARHAGPGVFSRPS